MKKILSFVLCLILCICVVSGCSEENGDGSGLYRANIVVVMDISDSMNKTDAGKCAIFATNMLLSAFDDYKVPLKNSANVNFGVVTFGHTESEIHEVIPLTNMQNANIESMRQDVENIEYYGIKGTNFFAGLEKAMDMCEEKAAEENYIFVVSDGKFDIYGKGGDATPEDGNKENADALADYKQQYVNWLTTSSKYIIHALGVDTREDVSDSFEDLKGIATRDENGVLLYDEIRDGTADTLADIFAKYIEKLYSILNPEAEADSIIIDAVTEGNVCKFKLDKRYKTVQILIASNKTEESGKLKVETVKSPKEKEATVAQQDMAIKGGTIHINDMSGVVASVYIKDAAKGEWEITLNENASIIAKVYVFKPFPWVVIPIIAVVILIIVLIIMWALRIPPVRYRKKMIPGEIEVTKDSVTIIEKTPVSTIISGGKYLYKGRLTLGTLLNDKKYKKVVFNYRPPTDYEYASLQMTNKGTERITGVRIYAGSTESIQLSDEKFIMISWDE